MYFVMHSTVTNLFLRRLYNITNNLSIIFKPIIMRTLNNNQLSGTLEGTKSNTWNSRRRYR